MYVASLITIASQSRPKNGLYYIYLKARISVLYVHLIEQIYWLALFFSEMLILLVSLLYRLLLKN